MATTLDELLVGLGFEYDSGELDKFTNDVGNAVDVVKKLTAAAIGAAAAITGLVVATTAASDEQGKFADEIGESVENVDALQFALVRSGGAADGMKESLRGIARRASEASRGMGEGVKVFAMLGVSATGANGNLKSASDLLKEVSGKMQGLNKAKQIEFADKLGIKDSIRLLQQGPKEIQSLMDAAKALGVTTAEDAALSAQFQDSLAGIWRIAKQVSRVLTRSLEPILDSIAVSFTKWWLINREIIEQRIPQVIELIVKALKILSIITAFWISLKLVQTIFWAAKAFRTLSVMALVANASLALIPAIIFGIVAAIGVMSQDAAVFFRDGDSLIGAMIKRFPEWTEKIEIAASALATIYDLTMMAISGWKQLINAVKSGAIFEDFGLVLKQLKIDLTDLVHTSFDVLIASFWSVVAAIKTGMIDAVAFAKTAVAGLWDNLIQTIDAIGNSIRDMFKSVWTDITDAFYSVVISGIQSALDSLLSGISDRFKSTIDAIKNPLSMIKDKINKSVDFVMNSEIVQTVVGQAREAVPEVQNITEKVKESEIVKESVTRIKEATPTIKAAGPGSVFNGINPMLSPIPESSIKQSTINNISDSSTNSTITNAASKTNSNSTRIDKVEIIVNGATDPRAVAEEISSIFHQTATELSTAVDQ